MIVPSPSPMHDGVPLGGIGLLLQQTLQRRALILYYLQHREKMEAYLADWLEWGKAVREQQERNPPPVVLRLRAAKQAHQVG